jgi:ribosome maturation factor RimP
MELAEPLVASQGMEIVEIECHRMKSRWLVRLYIDREGGATIDDCARVSHELGDVLNVYNVPPGPYNLEVSSPGLNRPLVREKDFMTYRGHTVAIRLGEGIEGRKNFKGLLKECIAAPEGLLLVVEVEGREYRIPRSLVVKAHLEYDLSHGGIHS